VSLNAQALRLFGGVFLRVGIDEEKIVCWRARRGVMKILMLIGLLVVCVP